MTTEQILTTFFLTPILSLVLWVLFPGKKGVFSLLSTSLALLLWCFLSFTKSHPSEIVQLHFLHFPPHFDIQISFLLSPVRTSLSFLAILFSLIIQIYSIEYLNKNENHGLFHFLISLFQSAMVWLFIAHSFFTLFLAWEIVGLCSYLLVQFWYSKQDVLQSGLKVLLINKLGDVFLLSGAGLFVSFGLQRVVYSEAVFPAGTDVFLASNTGQILSLFLVMAACIKSAQFPFSLWLKEAMSGPTSVSALLHSATMVVAGVWVLSQLSPVLSQPIHHFILVIGLVTFILSNLAAVFSNYLKTTFAFSTMAQLGLMMAAIGLSNPDGALLHVYSHAFYKAALFLFCGYLMHQAEKKGFMGANAQLITNLKSSLANQPFYRWLFIGCCAALAGFPLTSGFISKENLMPDPWTNQLDTFQWVSYGILQLGYGITAFYAMRLAFYIGFGPSESTNKVQVPLLFGIPILLLSLGSGFWLFGPNPLSTEGWITEYWNFSVKLLHPDVLMIFLGTFLAWKMTWKMERKSFTLTPFWHRALLDLSLPNQIGLKIWKTGIRIAGYSLKGEELLIEKPIDLGAKTVLVAGYFAAFTDRFGVDSIVAGLAGLAQATGEFLWEHTRRYPQYVVWFAVTVLLILIYFSYY